jgi:acetyl esterase/lipase
LKSSSDEDLLTLPSAPAAARIPYGADPNQFLDLRSPGPEQKSKNPAPLIINIHGGFWRSRYGLDHAGHLCAALTAKRLVTANVEYRRVGNEGGAWPASFDDIRTAYNFLIQGDEQHNFDPGKLLIMGHSAGAQLALCLAAREQKITRVISLAGVVDLERAYQLHLSNDAVVEFLRGTPHEAADHYREADPMQLSIPQARQLLIHGTADDVVPLEFSREYVALKQKRAGKEKEKVQLEEIPGAGHFALIDPRTPAWKKVEQAILRFLV